MYDELGPDGRRAHTVQQIADEFGVTRPTIYRHLQRPSPKPRHQGDYAASSPWRSPNVWRASRDERVVHS